MATDNILQFPRHHLAPSFRRDWVIGIAHRAGLSDARRNDLLNRLQPLIDLLDTEISARFPVPVDFSEDAQRAIERFLDQLTARDDAILLERAQREADRMRLGG